MRIENIRALELLAMGHKAAANSCARAEFEQTLKQLGETRTTQERLVFELLEIAHQSLQSGRDPTDPLVLVVRWRPSVDHHRIPEYMHLLHDIVVDYFEFLGKQRPLLDCHPWVLTLAITLGTIRAVDEHTFSTLVAALRLSCAGEPNDRRSEILAEAQKILSASHK